MSNAENILVVLPSPMGDAILATAALTRLRKALPNVRITFLGNSTVEQILNESGLYDEIIIEDIKQANIFQLAKRLKGKQFDAAIVMPNSFRSVLFMRLAGIKKIIAYSRDGRGLLLSHPAKPLCCGRDYAVLSMLDYYGYLIEHSLNCLNVNDGSSYLDDDYKLNLAVSGQDRKRIDSLLAKKRYAGSGPLVVLVPGGAFGGSKWWSANNFAVLAEKLIQQLNCLVFISCAPNSNEIAIAQQIIDNSTKPIINLLDEGLSVGELKELIRRADLVVSNDTGPCHIAAAFDTPLVTLFGPTDPRWTATDYTGEIRLMGQSECRPCQKSVCRRNHICMRSITVQEVLDAAKSQLAHAKDKAISGVSRQLPDYFDVYRERFLPLQTGLGLMNNNYRQLLNKYNLDNIDGVFQYQKGETLSKPGLSVRRERIRLVLNDDNSKETAIYLKRYGRPTLADRIKHFFTPKQPVTASNDFAGALALAKIGIDVPRPIVIGWEGSGFAEKRSFVMLEELPRADALERLLPKAKEKAADYPLLADRKKLIDMLAAVVSLMHSRRFFHRDLYLCHIFLAKDSADRQRLCLIDLQRVFKPKWLIKRWQVKDLAQLYYSGREHFSTVEIMRFLHKYFDTPDLNWSQKVIVRAVYRKAQRIARHDAKRQKRFNASPQLAT